MSRTLERADSIERRVLKESAALYDEAVAGVIRKHRKTLADIRQLEEKGEYARVRVLARHSGLLNDLANALAGAGNASAQLIRTALGEVREVMADDDPEEA